MKFFIVGLFIILSKFSFADEKPSLTTNDYYRAKLEMAVESHLAKIQQDKAILDYNLARVEHRKKLMEVFESMYKTQRVMSVGVFLIVSALVIGGGWLSYRQFLLDAEEQRQATSRGDRPKSAIKISKEGVEFSSSVIGLIMLFMSFFFFYMYVSEVYTMKYDRLDPLVIDESDAGK